MDDKFLLSFNLSNSESSIFQKSCAGKNVVPDDFILVTESKRTAQINKLLRVVYGDSKYFGIQ